MGVWDQFYERARSFFADSGGSAETKSRCYYDLLEVHRDATVEEIKRSFKKQALKWHPDKNPERAEECTAYFVLIQQAYEVLLDPQERAFYDRHRENIIHQSSGGEGSEEERRDTGINLEPFMNSACFRGSLPNGSGDEEQGEKFYAVFRELFHRLAAEEYAHIEDVEERNFPVFGKATSDYDTLVAPFYAFWLDFYTRRSFAWLDKWDLRQAPDRASARIMEKENKKLREHGKKQRSDEVRRLVEFVRKNDKRVAQAKERQRERNSRMQQIVEEQRLQTIRQNLEKLETFEVDKEAHQQHLAHLEEIEQALDVQFGAVEGENSAGGSGQEDEADRDGQLRCIVCEKLFKSRQVLINHQRSKKHRQMVDLLREHMREEDLQLFEEDGEQSEEGERDKGKRRKRKGRKKAMEETEEREREEKEEKAEDREKEETEEENGESKKNKAAKGKKETKKDRMKQPKPKEVHQQGPKSPVACECMTCGSEFESKTKLHAHLRDSGHAAIKPSLAPTASKMKRNKNTN